MAEPRSILAIGEGDRMLLFLREDTDQELLPPAYSAGVYRGWIVVDETLEPSVAPSEYDGRPLSKMEAAARDVLSGRKPASPPRGFVPIKDAPVPE